MIPPALRSHELTLQILFHNKMHLFCVTHTLARLHMPHEVPKPYGHSPATEHQAFHLCVDVHCAIFQAATNPWLCQRIYRFLRAETAISKRGGLKIGQFFCMAGIHSSKYIYIFKLYMFIILSKNETMELFRIISINVSVPHLACQSTESKYRHLQ